MTDDPEHIIEIASSLILGAGAMQTLVIPRTLPGLNEILNAKGSGSHAYNQMKREIEEEIYYLCQAQDIRPVERAEFRFVWMEKDRRRDPDNIVAARKFILDGLVAARRLPGDGWKHVIGFRDEWRVCKNFVGVFVRFFDPWPN